MKILAIDVGTGTQDIFLFDSRLDLENCFKLVLPSPTMIIYRRLHEATRLRQPVLLSGVTMGGGPSTWAAEAHLKAGLPLFATEDAARTFNDDLDTVREMGVTLISDDEVSTLPKDLLHIRMQDLDFPAIEDAFSRFGVSLAGLDALAVAVFDHGAAPPGISDRQFRFDFLDGRIRDQNRLSAFAFLGDQVPPRLTRLQAVATSAQPLNLPLVVMDTAPAAILGATYDAPVASRERIIAANIGNFHTLAFRLAPGRIEGVFEHHTGFLNLEKLESLLKSLADGTLTNEDVYNDMGHGALVYSQAPYPLDRQDFNVVVTGPRRSMLRGSSLRPYFAVPYGDMMIAGCFGLLAATANRLPQFREPILSILSGAGSGTPPWEVD